MTEQTKPKTYIELTEEMLDSEIKAIVFEMDSYLTNNPDGIGFIPKPLLNVFESHSSHKGKGRYKASTSKYAYVVPRSKAPQKQHDYLTSYKQNQPFTCSTRCEDVTFDPQLQKFVVAGGRVETITAIEVEAVNLINQ